MRFNATTGCKVLITLLLASCNEPDTARWSGNLDTVPSGQIVVTNGDAAVWREGDEWQVRQIRRIGQLEGDGPDVFGEITAFAVDDRDRVWILDDHAQEIRVFTETGEHVRTIGRKGSGPGEFSRAVRIDRAPSGEMWVMDPQNNRIAVFDTAGTHLHDKPGNGTFLIFPWPGGFDEKGRYYSPTPRFVDGNFSFVLARYDAALNPVDTLQFLRDPHERKNFSVKGSNGGMSAGVPFQGGLLWRISRNGTMRGLVTDEYKLFEVNAAGDTVRTITRNFTPAPVTDADRAEARKELEWFTRQGGQVDWSELPKTKPVANGFFEDDEGNVWVDIISAESPAGTRADVFDASGRYLGLVRLPFKLQNDPAPLIRRNRLYAVAHDSLDVASFVIAAISKPGANEDH